MLRAAVSIEKSQLPADLLAAVRRLSGPRPRAFTGQLVLTWTIVVAAVAVAEWANVWWATLMAIVVIGVRQSVLTLLTHEQIHRLAYRAPAGDLLVNLLCAFPLLFITTEGYAQVHLAHHRHYFTDQDPDHRRKSGAEWAYPKAPRAFLELLLRDVTGLNFMRLVRGKRLGRPGHAPPSRSRREWTRALFLATLATVLTLTGSWRLFIVYWLIPLFTVLQLIVRWGAVCEHEYNRPGARVADSTPLIIPPWWQQLLLPNLNFNMHVYHHHFPGVACSNLPRVHALFAQQGLVDQTAVFRGYGAYLHHLLTPAPRPRSG
jgi:fatty acid desaturase